MQSRNSLKNENKVEKAENLGSNLETNLVEVKVMEEFLWILL